MTLPSRIFLVGLPGVGKSTVGAYLAKELGYSFQDLDALIEEVTGRPISEIFEREGEQYFRKLEAEQLRSLNNKKIIVATGGGTPYFHNGINWMNENGFTIFLNPPLETIISRIKREEHRPLIGDDAKNSLTVLLEKRITSYKQAGMESSLSEPYEILAELLNSFSGKLPD